MQTTKLEKINACCEAREWVATQKNYKEAWQNCERGDWMLWLAKRLDVDDRKLTLAKFKCANQVRHLMKDSRSIAALDAAERYGNGEINRDELNTATAAAYAAYAAAAAAYAAAADADADAYAARKKNQLQTANICREFLTAETMKIIKEKYEQNAKNR